MPPVPVRGSSTAGAGVAAVHDGSLIGVGAVVSLEVVSLFRGGVRTITQAAGSEGELTIISAATRGWLA